MLVQPSQRNPRHGDRVGNPCPRLPSSIGMVISHHPKEADSFISLQETGSERFLLTAQCTTEDVSMTEAVKMGMALLLSFYNIQPPVVVVDVVVVVLPP